LVIPNSLFLSSSGQLKVIGYQAFYDIQGDLLTGGVLRFETRKN